MDTIFLTSDSDETLDLRKLAVMLRRAEEEGKDRYYRYLLSSGLEQRSEVNLMKRGFLVVAIGLSVSSALRVNESLQKMDPEKGRSVDITTPNHQRFSGPKSRKSQIKSVQKSTRKTNPCKRVL